MRPIDKALLRQPPEQRRAIRYSASVRRRRLRERCLRTRLTLRLLIVSSGLFLLAVALSSVISKIH